MQGLIELAIIFVAIYVYLKFCGICQRFEVGGGAKKFIYILTAVGMVIGNYLFNHSEIYGIGVGFVILILFTVAIMSQTKTVES